MSGSRDVRDRSADRDPTNSGVGIFRSSRSSSSSETVYTELEVTPLSPENGLQQESGCGIFYPDLNRNRLGTAPTSETEPSSSPEPEATIFTTLSDQSVCSRPGGTRSSLTANWASSEEQLDLAEPDKLALFRLQRQLENKREALNRLIAKASEEDKAQNTAADELQAELQAEMQAEHIRIRHLLTELGQMSQEAHELNQQLQAAEEKYGKMFLVGAAPAAAAGPKDSALPSFAFVSDLQQELFEERRRLSRALRQLEDQNSQIEEQKRELDSLNQRLGGEEDMLRLQAELDTERQSASSLAKKLSLEKDKSGELREQLKNLLEARKVDSSVIEALELKLAALGKELADMQQGIAHRDNRSGELQEQLRSLTEARQLDAEQHRKQLIALSAELKAANEQARRQAETTHLNKQLETMRAELDAAYSKISEIAEARQIESDNFTKQIDNMTAELVAANEQVSKVTELMQLEQNRMLETTRAELDAAKTEISKIAQTKQFETEHLNKQLETMRAELNAGRVEISNITQARIFEKEQFNKQLDAMRTERDAARAEILDITQARCSEADHFIKQIETLRTEQLESVKTELNAATGQISKLNEARELDNQRFAELETRLNAANDQVSILTAARQNDAEQHSKHVEAIRKIIKKQIDKMDKRQSELQSELRTRSIQLDSFRNQICALSDKAKEESLKLAELEKRHATGKPSTIDLARELHSRIGQLNELTRQLSGVAQQITHETTLREAGEAQLENLRCELLTTLDYLKEKDADIESAMASRVVNNPEADEHCILDEPTVRIKEQNDTIQSLNLQIRNLSSEMHSLELANANFTRELQESRADAELLLAKVDILNARIACYNSNLNAKQSRLHLYCTSWMNKQAEKCFTNDAQFRLNIERRIALLGLRVRELDEIFETAVGTPGTSQSESQSQLMCVSGRIRDLDDHILQLMGGPQRNDTAFDSERPGDPAQIVTSTPVVSAPIYRANKLDEYDDTELTMQSTEAEGTIGSRDRST